MPTQKLSPHDPITLLEDIKRSTSERVCENQPSPKLTHLISPLESSQMQAATQEALQSPLLPGLIAKPKFP